MPLTANAGLLDDIKDAVVGHTTDAYERVFVDEEYVSGQTVSMGTFRDDDRGRDLAHWVNGSVSVIEADGERYVQLNGDFAAGPAPDLFLYVGHFRIEHEDDFLQVTELGPLTRGSGASYYRLPTDIEFSEVVVWCKRFHQFMGAATLTEPISNRSGDGLLNPYIEYYESVAAGIVDTMSNV